MRENARPLTLALPCGRETLTVRLPERSRGRVTLLESTPLPPLADPAGAVAAALEAPLGSPALAALARGRRSACLVVSDATRPVPNREILPPLLRALEAGGLPADAVTLLVATGMHRPCTPAELAELVGPEVAARYPVINHDCRDRGALRRVATIEGAPVELNRAYLDADLKILTGLIEPHAFAGFSGGGKSVLPGLASFDTMAFMHSYALVERLGAALGRVEGNPFREYIDQVCAAAGADFLVNVLVDKKRRTCGVFAGDVREGFRAGCERARRQQLVALDRPGDLVVTTGGGHPLDQTLYQAIKGLVAARTAVRRGGTMLLVAGCEEGLGSQGFRDVIRSCPTPARFWAHYSKPENFTVDQWAVQAFFQTLEHAGRVLLYAPGLSRGEAEALGLEWVEDLEAALERLLTTHETVYAVPEGPYVSGVPGGEPVAAG